MPPADPSDRNVKGWMEQDREEGEEGWGDMKLQIPLTTGVQIIFEMINRCSLSPTSPVAVSGASEILFLVQGRRRPVFASLSVRFPFFPNQEPESRQHSARIMLASLISENSLPAPQPRSHGEASVDPSELKAEVPTTPKRRSSSSVIHSFPLSPPMSLFHSPSSRGGAGSHRGSHFGAFETTGQGFLSVRGPWITR